MQYSRLANLFFEYVPGINDDGFMKIKNLYDNWDFWIVFTAGFTPIPFKLITISAGTFNINFFMFVLASIISRSARFFIVAFLIRTFGFLWRCLSSSTKENIGHEEGQDYTLRNTANYIDSSFTFYLIWRKR